MGRQSDAVTLLIVIVAIAVVGAGIWYSGILDDILMGEHAP